MRYRFFSQFFVASLVLLGVLGLNGCGGKPHFAPVVNAWYQPKQATYYRVHRGDTIYSIAWAFGLDYRALAKANRLKPPYFIESGQRLKMTVVPSGHYPVVPAQRNTHKIQKKVESKKQVTLVRKPQKAAKIKRYSYKSGQLHWRWPVRGQVVSYFSRSIRGRPGISIASRYRSPIHAAASGRVVYSGDGVRGYGNLIILKHNDSYLSAYAFNEKNLVRVGQFVRAGSVIALMGRNSAGHPRLYFEIRRDGRPINPLKYIK